VGLLRSFNGLEVALLEMAGGGPIGVGGGGTRAAGGRVKLLPKE